MTCFADITVQKKDVVNLKYLKVEHLSNSSRLIFDDTSEVEECGSNSESSQSQELSWCRGSSTSSNRSDLHTDAKNLTTLPKRMKITGV